MLFSTKELKLLGISPKSVVHVGAHLAEERTQYFSGAWQRVQSVIWIEAQESLAKSLESSINPDIENVICAAVWSVSGIEMKLKITNNSESTSLLGLMDHASLYPDIKVVQEQKIQTVRLDEILPKGNRIDFLNLDIQGAELHALIGLGQILREISYIYVEVNFAELYENCPRVEEIDEFLFSAGFRRISTRLVNGGLWGDAIYMKSHLAPSRTRLIVLGISGNLKNSRNRYYQLRSRVSFRVLIGSLIKPTRLNIKP